MDQLLFKFISKYKCRKTGKDFHKGSQKKNEIPGEEGKNENQKIYKGRCFYIFSQVMNVLYAPSTYGTLFWWRAQSSTDSGGGIGYVSYITCLWMNIDCTNSD